MSAAKHTFFGTLSQDSLSCIVPYVKTETLIPLLSRSKRDDKNTSPFAHITPRLFETLRIHLHNRVIFDFDNAIIEIGCCYRDVSAIESLLDACGTVFTKLVLYKVERFDGIDAFAARLGKYMIPSPESKVEMRTKTSVLSGAIDANTEISIADGEFVDTFSRTISGLRKMAIRGQESGSNTVDSTAPTLKALTYRGEQSEKLDHLWEIVGVSLEEVDLVVYGNKGWKNCMSLMHAHCRKLDKIRLGNPLLDAEVTEADLVDLLCSYGNQLLEARTEGLLAESCSRIVRACANVRFSVWNNSNEFGNIKSYENRVDMLNLVLKLEGLHDWTELSGAMKSCPSLVELVMHSQFPELTLDEERIQAIFPARMDFLESLSLNIRINTNCLFRIADVTSNLRSLNAKLAFSNSAKSIQAICRKNRRLESIKIMQYYAEFGDEDTFIETEDLVREFVQAAAFCSNSLREFTVNFHERLPPAESELQDACVLFRNRPISFFFRFDRCRFYRTRFGQCKFANRGFHLI